MNGKRHCLRLCALSASLLVTISGGGNFLLSPVMEVAAGATLNLKNISIAHGFSLIKVDADATLNLNNVSIADGFAFSEGGGIDNAGALTVACGGLSPGVLQREGASERDFGIL